MAITSGPVPFTPEEIVTLAGVIDAHVLSALKPTHYMRWRVLTGPDEPRRKSMLEQLWVTDGLKSGIWRQVPSAMIDAPALVTAEQLKGLRL